MLRKVIIAAACFAMLAFAAAPSHAQNAIPVASCGTLSASLNPAIPHALYMDVNGNLCIAGSFSATGGTISNATSGQATTSTNQGAVSYLYGFNGTTWDQLQVDASKFLKINCVTGCAGGTFNNNADNVATSATNGQNAVWNYVWDGATWDRLYGDSTNGAFSHVKAWAGTALGAPSAYGTSPGAVNVPGVNAFVTNTLTGITPGDAIATGTYPTGSPTIGAMLLWNGTTYDRWKSAGATGVAAIRQTDGTNVQQLDPCQSEVKSTLPITLATAAVKVIAVGVSAKKIYVCQIHLTNNAADSVAVFEATTATTCATSPVAVVGAGTTVATAATGYNFAANGGISLGTGSNQVLQTSVNANDLCIAQSAATQLTGSITYVTR